LILIDDNVDPGQHDAFGLPTPRNGLFEHLVQQMLDAWSWRYVEDGQPLEFESGAYSARMAGRIMPAPWRQMRPLLAREVGDEDAATDAARRGWPIQLRGVAPERLAPLIASYRATLASAGHSESTVHDCLRWLVVVVEVPGELSADRLASLLRDVERSGAAEVRVDPTPGVSLDELTAALRPNLARSA
jgi:alkanesulfonate monooxygenase SsuD/methylene tetrahydromethanopterin reductase-like flavin-dependent oxidoreductase (luciferase family)